MLQRNSYTPQTQVVVHTWRGQTYDLTNSLMTTSAPSWTRTKTLETAAGTFTLNLLPNQPWQKLLMPMDYVEIRASKTGKKVNGKFPIIMRGFIDRVGDSKQFGSTGGPSEPRLVIIGRDYTKLLIEWQILYLFTQNTFKSGGNLASIAAQAQGFGMYLNFDLPIYPTSITSFMIAMMQKMVNPIFAGLRNYKYKSLPGLNHSFKFPDYPMSSINIMSYTGSYLNLFEYVVSPPFGELFVEEGPDTPILVSRMTPYRDLSGKTPSPAASLTNAGEIIDISGIDTTFSDTDVYTYFLTWGASTQQVGLTQPVFATGKNNGVFQSSANLYGQRPLIIDTSWIAEYDGANPKQPNSGAIQIGSQLNEWLMATMEQNAEFLGGTISCHGDESYQIGQYRTVPATNQEFYIAGIQDSFTIKDGWTAYLTVERGRNL